VEGANGKAAIDGPRPEGESDGQAARRLLDKHLGGTYAGYSDSIVVDQRFVLRVPPNLDLAGAAPLLCAGITTYSPLRH
jgi:D-arabinose 1-dehydrogenase-like Zn-dependent alcohol dehydrogenase